MLLIPCPHCGERDETEFRYGGEVQPETSVPIGDLTPAEAWGERLFLRSNEAGLISEAWFHLHGCQHWIELRRDTRTDTFISAAPSPRTSDDGP